MTETRARYRLTTPPRATEHEEQVALFQFAQLEAACDPRWALLNSSQNGLRASSVRAAVAAKAAGMKKGFPDLTFPVPIPPYHGLFIELKRKNGVPSNVKPEQRQWLADLKDQGYYAEVAYGWEDAKYQIQNYLLGHKKTASRAESLALVPIGVGTSAIPLTTTESMKP